MMIIQVISYNVIPSVEYSDVGASRLCCVAYLVDMFITDKDISGTD